MRIARANPPTPSTWVIAYYVWSVWSCRVAWQVPESGCPEEGDDFGEGEEAMEEDDEGYILDCKVVHGFRWYRVRVTTRAVSTQVRACVLAGMNGFEIKSVQQSSGREELVPRSLGRQQDEWVRVVRLMWWLAQQ